MAVQAPRFKSSPSLLCVVGVLVRTWRRFAEIEGRRALEVESKRKGDRPLTFSARRDRVRLWNAARAVINWEWA